MEVGMTDEKKESKLGAILGAAAGAVKLDWVRPLIYKVGGRKMAMGAGGLAVIQQIVSTGEMTWPRAVACLAVALVAVGSGLSMAWEDGKEKEAETNEEK
jgi:hypothetical protein